MGREISFYFSIPPTMQIVRKEKERKKEKGGGAAWPVYLHCRMADWQNSVPSRSPSASPSINTCIIHFKKRKGKWGRKKEGRRGGRGIGLYASSAQTSCFRAVQTCGPTSSLAVICVTCFAVRFSARKGRKRGPDAGKISMIFPFFSSVP